MLKKTFLFTARQICRNNVGPIQSLRWSSTHVAADTVDKSVDATVPAKLLIGSFFDSLDYSGRQGNQLALGDLRKLMQMCEVESDLTYVKNGVELYQKKGQDFSEEVNAHFIQACLRAGNPKVASDLFSVYANRISAWSTPKTFHMLVESLISRNELESVVKMLSIVSKKGVIASKETFDIIFIKLQEVEDKSVMYIKLMTSASKMLTPGDVEYLKSRYPDPSKQ